MFSLIFQRTGPRKKCSSCTILVHTNCITALEKVIPIFLIILNYSTWLDSMIYKKKHSAINNFHGTRVYKPASPDSIPWYTGLVKQFYAWEDVSLKTQCWYPADKRFFPEGALNCIVYILLWIENCLTVTQINSTDHYICFISQCHCGLEESVHACYRTGCKFKSWQCRINISHVRTVCLRSLGFLRGSLGTYGLIQKLLFLKYGKCNVLKDSSSSLSYNIIIIIIYFSNIHFFHAQLGLDICSPLHISLSTAHSGCKPSSSIIITVIIKNISPSKLIDEPQMHLCSSHLSNKNVFSNFRNESKLKDGSFILAGRSFQIVHVIFYTFPKFSQPPLLLFSPTTSTYLLCRLTPKYLHFYVPHAQPSQSTSPHHLSHAQNTQKTVQDLTLLPILQRRTTHHLK